MGTGRGWLQVQSRHLGLRAGQYRNWGTAGGNQSVAVVDSRVGWTEQLDRRKWREDVGKKKVEER